MAATYSIAVIGDWESVMGFRALGLDTYPVTSVEEARKTVHDLAKTNCAVIYLTETLAKDMADVLDRYKDNIQPAISRHFDGMRLDKETAKEVLDRYGAERVSIVLAATVQYKSWDGRFSSSNKDWAFSMHLPEGQSASGFDRRSDYIVDSHPAVLDGFIWQARREIRERQNPSLEKEALQKAPSAAAKAAKRKTHEMER